MKLWRGLAFVVLVVTSCVTSPQEKIHAAAKAGDLEKVAALLKEDEQT